tara:strand:- start:696 stop:1667 length:972 start_codon:yes stop_codon:yes gene_type:complete
MNTIAVDAMGGDSAPVETVKGAIKAKEDGINVVLCGDENLVKPYLGNVEIPVYHYPQVISMDEDPLKAIRAKKEASIIGCMQLLKEKKVEAVFSAGSTGATLISAITVLGKQKGVIRPAIASVLPTTDGSVILLDSGASLDVKPKVLYQFAVMGSKLAEVLLDLDKPRVGLLNNGEEESKGRDLEKSAYKLLSSSTLNFIGNVEGRDFASEKVDVFVTDGFTGNVVLKTLEGTARLQQKLISDSLKKNLFKPLLPIVKNALEPVKNKLNPDKTNASYLLGVDGLVTIGHGSSKQEAIKNGIKYTNNSVQKDFIGKFSETLNEL